VLGLSAAAAGAGAAGCVSAPAGHVPLRDYPSCSKTSPGFSFLLDPKGPHGIAVESWLDRPTIALVLNDFQKFCTLEKFGFTNAYNTARYRDVVLPNTIRLLERFRRMGRPVVYTVLATQDPAFRDLPGVPRKVLARDLKRTDGTPYHLRDGSEDAAVPDELAPAAGDVVIVKASSGAFGSSDIDAQLRRRGIASLVFTGGISELCLQSTVRGAYDRGYLCTVAEDATITANPDRQKWAMEFLAEAYAWVTRTEEILQRLG
jgi:ureidoacrylate peracid hydrolase